MGAEIGGRQPGGRAEGSKGTAVIDSLMPIRSALRPSSRQAGQILLAVSQTARMTAATEDGGRLHGNPDAVSHGWSRLVAVSRGVLRKKIVYFF